MARTADAVLVIAEAVTLAHVGRAARVASLLNESGIDVQLACDPAYTRFLGELPYPVVPLPSLASEEFMAALDRGSPVFTEASLESHVRDDLRLLERLRPRAVIGDFRLSLSVSARVAGVPYINVTNAYWSPFARPRFRMPALARSPGALAPVADPVFRCIRPLVFAWHARPMNRVRRAHGLPAFPPDVRTIYCDGDLTLYADWPELVPVFGAPETHRYVGPLMWSPNLPLPSWWSDVPWQDGVIYLSLGSSGAAKLLPVIAETLAATGHPVVVATAGRAGVSVAQRPGVWVADFVPGQLACAHARLVVSNGGSPTVQQALTNGVPVIGVCSNLDQFLNMGYVEAAGAGVLLPANRLHRRNLSQAAQRLMEGERGRTRAAQLSLGARRIDPARALADALNVHASSITASLGRDARDSTRSVSRPLP